jgi:hypothetical protein
VHLFSNTVLPTNNKIGNVIRKYRRRGMRAKRTNIEEEEDKEEDKKEEEERRDASLYIESTL